MSATSRLVTSPTPSKSATAASGSSVWTWTLRVASSPTTRTESPRPSSRGRCSRAVEPGAGDDEVRAVAEAAVLVVGRLRRGASWWSTSGTAAVVAAQPGDDAGQDQDQAVAAGVDDARFAQHLELLGGALDRALAVLDRPLEDLGEDRVLLLLADPLVEALAVGVEAGELAGDRVRHLAEDGQHRPLGRLADRVVGGVGGAGEGGGDEHRVDQLAGAAGELLGGAADDLAEDHAGVAAGAHQRRPGQRLDQLGAADLVDLLAVEAVELLHHGAHRHRHVVAGVAVGDREDVEVVDLLAALLEVGVGGRHHPAKAHDAGIGHWPQSNCRAPTRADPPGFASVRRPMRRFATWCTGHRKTVIIGWIVALIGFGMIAGAVGLRLLRRLQAARLRLGGSLRTARRRIPGAVGRHGDDRLQGRSGVESPAVRRAMEGALRQGGRAPPRQRSRQPLRERRRRRRSATTARSPTRPSSTTSSPTKSKKRTPRS